MKKGGLLSKGSKVTKKEYKSAPNVLRQWELGLLRARYRLAEEQQEVCTVFLRV